MHINNKKIWRLVLFISLSAIFLSNALAQNQSVEQKIYDIINNSEADGSIWSVSVRDSTGTELVSLNSEQLIKPASNIKLLTSAAVLNKLSPEFTFKTPLYAKGEQEGHTWMGDLIVKGVGDPTISDVFGKDPFLAFDKFIQKLKQMQIKKIAGGVIGNASFFDKKPYPKGWNWDDLPFYYGVEINALSFNDNCVDLTVTADAEVGAKPSITWFPLQTDYIEFNNRQVITLPGTEYKEDYRRLPGSHSIYLGSTLPQGYIEEECLSVPDPAKYFADTFTIYAEKQGIEIRDEATSDYRKRNWESDKYQLIAEYESAKLDRMINQINKESDNFISEMLLKTASVHFEGEPGSTENGIEMIREFAHETGMDTTRLVLTDASGMSTHTLTTTADLTRFLNSMRSTRYFNTFYNSLSVSGEEGTLSYRMKNKPLRKAIYGKSGFISGIRTISGYIQTSSHQKLSFSLVTNHYTIKTRRIDRLHESILELIHHTY